MPTSARVIANVANIPSSVRFNRSGATESELPLDAWNALATAVPTLSTLAADVEAALLRRRDNEVDAFIVPIDVAYELVGRMRRGWRGFSGGDEVWREIDAFFARVTERAGSKTAESRDVPAGALSMGQRA